MDRITAFLGKTLWEAGKTNEPSIQVQRIQRDLGNDRPECRVLRLYQDEEWTEEEFELLLELAKGVSISSAHLCKRLITPMVIQFLEATSIELFIHFNKSLLPQSAYDDFSHWLSNLPGDNLIRVTTEGIDQENIISQLLVVQGRMQMWAMRLECSFHLKRVVMFGNLCELCVQTVTYSNDQQRKNLWKSFEFLTPTLKVLKIGNHFNALGKFANTNQSPYLSNRIFVFDMFEVPHKDILAFLGLKIPSSVEKIDLRIWVDTPSQRLHHFAVWLERSSLEEVSGIFNRIHVEPGISLVERLVSASDSEWRH